MEKILNFTDFLNEAERNDSTGLTLMQETHLKAAVKGTWKVNTEKKVDVNGDVYFFGRYSLTKIPVNFGKVTGNFNLSDLSKLKTLEGSPTEVGGWFSCSSCTELESLKGGPKIVGGYFSAYSCRKLTNLEGAPEKVGGIFNVSFCSGLTSLKGATPGTKGISYACCSSLPKEELDLAELSQDLLSDWLKAGSPPIKDFLHKKRGTIKGKEFGF